MEPGIGRLVVGLVIAAVGGGITYASYQSAEAGGSYVVLYGLILFGLWTAIQGLSVWWGYRRATSEYRRATSEFLR